MVNIDTFSVYVTVMKAKQTGKWRWPIQTRIGLATQGAKFAYCFAGGCQHQQTTEN